MKKYSKLKFLGFILLATALTACSGEAAKQVDTTTKDAASTVAATLKEVATETVAEVATPAESSMAVNDDAADTNNTSLITSGTFTGRNDHITTGGVSIVKTADGYQLILAGDFSLDGAPDPIVALGNNDTYSPENKLAALKNISGSQAYEIPASINPSDFSEAYIWCEQFNVSLGIAPLANPAVVSAGTFTGRNDHITAGDASIVRTATGYQLILADDFSLDGAPDPIVALGNNGIYSPENKLAPLKNISGSQAYEIPVNMNPADFSEAYIWCEQFNVSLGIAPLTPTNSGS